MAIDCVSPETPLTAFCWTSEPEIGVDRPTLILSDR